MAQSTSSTGNQPLIELRHVDKHYGDLHVLNDINLSVDRGEVVVVIRSLGLRQVDHVPAPSTAWKPSTRARSSSRASPCRKKARMLARMRAELGMVFQQFNPVRTYDRTAERHAGTGRCAGCLPRTRPASAPWTC